METHLSLQEICELCNVPWGRRHPPRRPGFFAAIRCLRPPCPEIPKLSQALLVLHSRFAVGDVVGRHVFNIETVELERRDLWARGQRGSYHGFQQRGDLRHTVRQVGVLRLGPCYRVDDRGLTRTQIDKGGIKATAPSDLANLSIWMK